MRKALAFDILVKATLAIVIVVIGISLVSTFMSNDMDVPGKMKDTSELIVKGSYNDADPDNDPVTESYTSARIARLIADCYSRTIDSDSDLPCYVVQGEFNQVDKDSILKELADIEQKAGSRTNITSDFANTDMILIYYDATDKIIDIKD